MVIYSPKCVVRFKTITDQMICDVSSDLISLSTNKAYGKPAGTWQMILSYKPDENGKRYHEKLAPDNLVTIEMTDDGGKLLPVMLGLVDRVSLVYNVDAQGKPIRYVKVSGRDLGKLLLVHDIGWDIKAINIQLAQQKTEASDEQKIKNWQSMIRYFAPDKNIGTASQLVVNLFDFAFANDIYLAKKFKINCVTDDTWVVKFAQFATLQGMGMWDALCRVADMPYNQLHADTGTNDVETYDIYLEKTPFTSDGKLSRNQMIELTAEDLISCDLGSSDHERVNFLFLQQELYEIASNQIVGVQMAHDDVIRYDKESVKWHGLNLHSIKSSFHPPSIEHTLQVDKKDAFKKIRERVSLLWNWHKEAHTYESGSLQIHLRPDIRAGQGIKIKQPNGKYKEYLVEQTGHQLNWGVNSKFTTILHVTRGQEQ